MVNTKILVGFLVLLIASATIVYISMNDVKIRVDNDKSTFYVIENGRWVISGAEYISIFEGSSKMNRNLSGIKIETIIDSVNQTVTIIKTTPYIKGPIIRQTYFFIGSVNNKEIFPMYHKVEVINASGKFLRYEVQNLVYSGGTYKLSGDVLLSFGRSMKVKLNSGYNWAWVYSSGTVRAQYNINSDYDVFSFRLYDPATVTILYLNGTSVNRTYELGNPANITATIDYSIPVCLSIDHPNMGENFTCGIGNVTYLWNYTKPGLMKFNDSTIAKNLTFGAAGSQNVFLAKLHRNDTIDETYVNLTGFDNGGTYPKNITIDTGNDGIIDIGLIGELKGKYIYSNIFNDSAISKSFDSNNQDRTQPYRQKGTTNITYIKVSTAHNTSEFYLNVTGGAGNHFSYEPIITQESAGELEDQFGTQWICYWSTGITSKTKLYWLGGKCRQSDPYSSTYVYNVSFSYDPSASIESRWSRLYYGGSYLDIPYEAGAGACSWYNGTYIFIAGGGGNNPSSTAKNNMYYFTGTTWIAGTSMPEARWGASCVYVNGKLYMVGGIDSSAAYKKNVLIYNNSDQQWYTGTGELTIAKALHSVAQYNSTHLLVWGGYTSTFAYRTEYYNMGTDTFTYVGSSGHLYSYGGLFNGMSTDSGVYNIGGYNDTMLNIWEYPFKWDAVNSEWDEMTTEHYPWYIDYCCFGKWYFSYAYYTPIYAFGGEINGTWLIGFTGYSYASAYMHIYTDPIKPYLQVGYSGINQWQYNQSSWAGYGWTEKTPNLAQYLNNYIKGYCTGAYCDVPIYVHNDKVGNITINNINVTSYIPSLNLNKTAVQNVLNSCPTTYCNTTLNVSSKTAGIVQLDGINVSYFGSGIYNVTAFWPGNATYSASSDQHNLTIIFSNFSITWPPGVSYFEMILKNYTQNNVTPYGQTNSIPIWNFSSKAYDKPMNISIKLNQSIDSCFKLNLTSASTPNGKTISTTAYDYITNLGVGQTSSLWAFGYANNCNYTALNKRWLETQFVFQSKCMECI